MTRRRKWTIVAAIATVALVAGFVVGRPLLFGRGKVTEVPVDEVIRRYEESLASTTTNIPTTTMPATTMPATATPATATPASIPTTTTPPTSPTTTTPAVPPIAAPGVYVYTTTGGDSIDILNGDHHDYPAVTTMTIIPTDCGALQRWDVAEERWVELQQCIAADGVTDISRVNHDEFFGMGETQHWTCSGAPRPLDAPAGATWRYECRRDEGGLVESSIGTVIGLEDVVVGDTTVAALHVQVVTDNGNSSDSQVADAWYQQGTSLLLARTATNATTNSTDFGTVHYQEHLEIHLTSLQPVN